MACLPPYVLPTEVLLSGKAWADYDSDSDGRESVEYQSAGSDAESVGSDASFVSLDTTRQSFPAFRKVTSFKDRRKSSQDSTTTVESVRGDTSSTGSDAGDDSGALWRGTSSSGACCSSSVSGDSEDSPSAADVAEIGQQLPWQIVPVPTGVYGVWPQAGSPPGIWLMTGTITSATETGQMVNVGETTQFCNVDDDAVEDLDSASESGGDDIEFHIESSASNDDGKADHADVEMSGLGGRPRGPKVPPGVWRRPTGGASC